MTKKQLRTQALLKRNNISAQEIKEKSQQITFLLERFLNENIPFDDFLCYAPLKEEWDLTPFYEKMLNHSKTLYFPSLNLEKNTMDFYKITSLNQLCFTNIYGIKEPFKALLKRFQTNVNETKRAVILVPALLFDLYGTRLGFGKGFFDRFLALHHIFKIGITDENSLLTEPIIKDSWDIRMDVLISEKRIIIPY